MNVKICIHYSNYTHTLKTFRSNSKLLFEKGMVMSNAVLCLELFPEKTRFYAEAIGLFSWTTGLVVMAPLAYMMRGYSWRYLQVLLTSFSVFSLVQYW